MKKETYKAARVRLLREFRGLGWRVAEDLKVPWAQPTGFTRNEIPWKIWFKSQSLKVGQSLNTSHTLHGGQSWGENFDYRGASARAIAAIAENQMGD